MPSCPLCDANVVEPGVVVDLWLCPQCGSAFLSPQPDDATLSRAYADAYGNDGAKFIAPIEWATRLAAQREAGRIAHELGAGARVLDVGAGRGVLASALAALGVEVMALERSSEASRGLDARVQLVVADSIDDAHLDGGYDLIVFRHVLEHLRSPVTALAAAHALLGPRGQILLEVPNFGSLQARVAQEHWLYLDLPRHLFHFSKAGLEHVCQRAGLSDVEVKAAFSLVQDPVGWIQSALNRAGAPPQRLYRGLHQGASRSSGFVVDCAVAAVSLPTAVGLSAACGAMGSGGVLRAVARRAV